MKQENAPGSCLCLAAVLLALAASGRLAAAPDANIRRPDAKSLVVELYFHNNGSVTITLDGKQHTLSPLEYRKQAEWLLLGKQEAVIRMEDWKGFERLPADTGRMLYQAGIRTLTLKPVVDGREETRTVELDPPGLAEQLSDRKATVRQAAIARLATMLGSENRSDRVNAMHALQRTRHVRFDRSQFLPLVRRSLHVAEPGELGRAIGTIGLVGGDASDLRKVLPHAEHESPSIRAGICPALFQLDPAGNDPRIGPAVVKLLNDAEPAVRTATFKSLWGCPSTPEIDARLIEMSRGLRMGGSSEADEVIYYALSTRPLVRVAVAQRLIELIGVKPPFNYRAVWGISHHRADEDARPLVVDALLRVVDAESDGENRQGAIWGLGFHGGEKALAKLQAIATSASETEKTRELAGRRLPAPAGETRPAPVSPVRREKPTELWEQIAQPHDPEVRQAALAEVQRRLKDKGAALEALTALFKARQAAFDRSAFVPLVLPYLESASDEIRSQALLAVATLGPTAVEEAVIAKHLTDESALVREAAGMALMVRDPKGESAQTSRAIEVLLNDRDQKVVQAVVHALWGFPTTPAAEAALIELSYAPELGDDVVYYSLSTRPLIRRPVAQRLIELASLSERDRGRAIWGLSHHPVADDARDLVVAALVEIVDNTSDGYDRSNAISGLGQLASDAAWARLQKIADAADESEAARSQACDLLQRFKPR
jgi:HEAT repeat protein